MMLDPFVRFLGIDRNSDPLELLGLTPDRATPADVEAALRRRISTVYSHPDGRSDDAEVVRRGLRKAADALRDPERRKRWIPAKYRTSGAPLGAEARARRAAASRPTPQLTEFDRQAMAMLVICGGWNAESRSRLVALAAARGVTVQGLQRVIIGLSEYAKNHGPRLGVREITSNQHVMEAMPMPPAPPTYVDRVVSNVAAELKGENPWATIRVSVMFAALTLVVGIVSLVLIFRGDPEGDVAVVDPEVPVPNVIETPTVDPAPAPVAGPVRPADFERPPTFQGEALPSAAIEAADLCPGQLRTLDLVGRRLDVADGDVSDAVFRQWDESLRVLSTGWVLIDEQLQRDIEAEQVELLALAHEWPGVMDRMLDGILPTSTRWVDPIDVWRDAWRAGMLGRIASERTLPPLLFDQARTSLTVAFDPMPIDELPEGFEASAAAWLDRVAATLVSGLEIDPDTHDAWELWLAARRRVSTDERQFHAAVFDVVEAILKTETDLSRSGPTQQVLGRLLIVSDFEKSAIVRERLLGLFDDPDVSAHDLWLLSSLLVHLDTSPWFGRELVLSDDAGMAQRSRVRDRIRRAWPPMADPATGPTSAMGTGVAVDAVGAARWIEAVDAHLARAPDGDPDVLILQLVEASALNEAAALLASGDPVSAHAILSRVEGGTLAAKSDTSAPGSIGQPIGGDGAWAATYKELGRNTEERLSALRGLRRSAGSDLGTDDAALLVREAYRGAPQEIRDEARAVASEMFTSGPTFVLELLDQFPDAPSNQQTSDFIARVTGRSLPSTREESWALEARRGLVEHALSLRYVGRQGFDQAAAVIAESYENRRQALTGEPYRGAVSRRPEEAAERLLDAWSARAATLIVSHPVPDDLSGLQRRMSIRSRLVDGAMQRFVARQVGLLDVLAYVTVAEQPVLTEDVLEVLRAGTAARAASGDVLDQALMAERTAFPLWRLRMSFETPDETTAMAIPIWPAIVMAAAVAPQDEWRDRLEALAPDRPMDYFLLAEEVAEAADDAGTRALAVRLFGLAGVLDRVHLGRSARLALADLAEDDIARRRLLALGSLIDDGAVGAMADTRLAEPQHDLDAVSAVLEAFSYYRRGQGSRALASLRTTGATELLEIHEGVLRGGVKRFLEDCKLYRGPLRPTLSEADITRMLLLELALVAGTDRPWSAELLLTRGAPLIEVDPEQLPETLGVDAGRPFFREGRWVSGE